MKLLLLAPFLVFSSIAHSQSLAGRQRMDEKYGFREVRFGSSLSSFTGLVLYKDDGARKMYRRKKENLTLGSYHLNKIVYTFYKGELSAVLYAIVGADNLEGVKRLLVTAYGPPEEKKSPQAWRSNKLDIQWLPIDKNSGFLSVESIPLRAKREIDAATLNTKAAGDL